MPKAMPPARKQPGEGRDIVSRGYFTTFGGVRRGEFTRGEYPRWGASANPSNSGGFWGVGGAQGKRAGDYPPRTFPARPGAIFARFAGSGSPPSASARPASRSPESARGANSPNALARGGGKQSRPAQQGKRFSARPSAFGGFGRMRRAGRVRGRRRGSPPVRRRDIFRYQLLSENIRARRKPQPRHIPPPPPSASRSPESARGANSPNARTRAPSVQPRTGRQGKHFSARPSAFGGFGGMRRAGRVRGRRRAAAGSGRGMTSPRFAGRGG